MEYQLSAATAAQFQSFPIDRLVDNSVTDFDLFIALEKHFILYSGTGYRWQRAELTELLGAGHERFYIRQSDLPKAGMYEQLAKLPQINRELAPPERIQHIEQVGARFLRCLYEGEVTEACVHKGKEVADAMAACVAEDQNCVRALSDLAQHDYYTYFHSVRVAAFASSIALGMGLKDMGLLRDVALGGIFHDIGKREVPLQVLNKSGALTETEWALVKSHPQLGFAQVGETILSHVPREIILHHHEKRNGAGYPDGLDKGSLLPEVQIATLADIFDALTSARAYQKKRTRFEALEFIKGKLVPDEISADAFKALVHCLAS